MTLDPDREGTAGSSRGWRRRRGDLVAAVSVRALEEDADVCDALRNRAVSGDPQAEETSALWCDAGRTSRARRAVAHHARRRR